LLHVPLHTVGAEAGQTQVPAEQIRPPTQAFPHLPQLFTSVRMLTQVPLQSA
jgi:hypothetical protein